MNVGFTGRIARSSARRPWVTLSVWAVALAAAVYFAGGLGDVVTQSDRNLITTESDHANDLRELNAPVVDTTGPETAGESVIVTSTDSRFGEPAFDTAIEDVVAKLATLEGVYDVEAPTQAAPYPVSESGYSALIQFELSTDGEAIEAFVEAVHELSADGFTFLPYGQGSAELSFDSLAEDTLVKGEMIGIGVAIVILVIVFGAFAAAGIPLGVALVSIITAVGLAAIVGQAFELSFFVLNMITMMGLALGIDYTLVMVQRFREELAKGHTVTNSVTIAGNTANRAVFFSGITVIISLIGMLVIPSTIMISLGAGAMLVAITSVAGALTLLPAVLKLLGARVNRGRIPTAHPGEEPKTWKAIANAVTARPAIAAIAGIAILGALAAPIVSMRLAFPGTDSLPEDFEFRQASEILVEDFGYGQSTTYVTIKNPEGNDAAIAALADAIEAEVAFAETDVKIEGDVVVIYTEDVFDSADIRSENAINTLRDELIPAALGATNAVASVGGGQAGSMDFTSLITDRVWLVLTIVLGSSFLFLLVAFRSIVIPLTSILLNVLSAAAAFGLLVAVFQYGWFSDIFGMPQVDGIAPWLPIFLFAVLFGLSMDYHVFLLSRIKEAHDNGEDTREAIAHGLGRTGSLITGAALIMVAVFGGFALGDMAEFSQMGFGLAAAVIIDATLVRSIIVPAVMSLLGKANWYLPSWLEWLPNMTIESAETPAPEVIEEELEPALV